MHNYHDNGQAEYEMVRCLLHVAYSITKKRTPDMLKEKVKLYEDFDNFDDEIADLFENKI